MRYPNSRGKMAITIAHSQISIPYMYRDERVVDVLRGLCRTVIIIAFIDPTDGSWSDDLMVSDNKWRPIIDALLYTSAKIIQLNMDVGMHHAKNRGNKEIPLAILSRILAQSCVTLGLNYVYREGLRMMVLVSLIVLLRGFPCFHDYSHGASLQPY